jgi:hypothetical protein
MDISTVKGYVPIRYPTNFNSLIPGAWSSQSSSPEYSHQYHVHSLSKPLSRTQRRAGGRQFRDGAPIRPPYTRPDDH